uniref:uncharacterized protein LOC120345986 n=1 Tax=Styela clava TaxID=7725 RepID=UPI00193A65CE|nr:uncharacterized protein LOC120345986 [Styela clava]
MYSSLKRRVSQTRSGTYKRNDWFLDFERLPWMEWMDLQPMRKGQYVSLQLLYPILLQEINIAKPSKLLHFLIGKGVLSWQDVVVIQHNRQTDMEMNAPFLRIIMTRGETGFYGFLDALRSRHGGWQGYLADMIDMHFNPAIVRDLLDVFKIVCHDLTRLTPAGWSALPRALGLSVARIERARRQNRLLVNQALHSLLLWSGHRDDKEHILNELLIGLVKIHRVEIAESLVRLVDMVHKLQRWRIPLKSKEEDAVFDESESRSDDEQTRDKSDRVNTPGLDSGMSLPAEEDLEVAAVFGLSRSSSQQSGGNLLAPRSTSYGKGKKRRNHQSVDSGFVSPVPSGRTPDPHGLGTRKYRAKPPRSPRGRIQRSYPKLRTLSSLSATDMQERIQKGRVYNYGLSPRGKSNAWENRSPTILQTDYVVHPNHDNLFMDYLIYQ